MKVWITKYALTTGIMTSEDATIFAGTDGMIRVSRLLPLVNDPGRETYFYGEGKEWHITPESALAKAKEMRKRKIESLREQIKKLSAMEFKIPEGRGDNVST